MITHENKANGARTLSQSIGISQNHFPIDYKYVVSRFPTPALVDVIKQAKETRAKLNKLCQENKPLFDKIMESAKQPGLLFNEFGNLILCLIDLQPRDLERDWHDYFLIEESIGSRKAFTFAEQKTDIA